MSQSDLQILRVFVPKESRVAPKKIVPTAQQTPPKTMVYLKEPSSPVTILPPMGDPVNAAIAAIEYAVPVRVPISERGDIFAHSAGVRLIPAPDPTPNSAAKVMMAALLVAGSHRPKIKAVVRALMTIMTLK